MIRELPKLFSFGRQTNPDSLAGTRSFLGLILPNAALFVERIDDCVQPFRYDPRTSCDLDESNFSGHGHSSSTFLSHAARWTSTNEEEDQDDEA